MNRFLPLHTEEFVADWGIDVRVHQWNAGTLKQVAQECDLAIVPVDLTDSLARGKAENRMVIFWRLGLPVLASASPANIRAAARCGFEDKVICTTAEDWKRNLQDLLAQSGERLPIAMAGQTLALTDYSEESLAQRWDHLFESLR